MDKSLSLKRWSFGAAQSRSSKYSGILGHSSLHTKRYLNEDQKEMPIISMDNKHQNEGYSVSKMEKIDEAQVYGRLGFKEP